MSVSSDAGLVYLDHTNKLVIGRDEAVSECQQEPDLPIADEEIAQEDEQIAQEDKQIAQQDKQIAQQDEALYLAREEIAALHVQLSSSLQQLSRYHREHCRYMLADIAKTLFAMGLLPDTEELRTQINGAVHNLSADQTFVSSFHDAINTTAAEDRIAAAGKLMNQAAQLQCKQITGQDQLAEATLISTLAEQLLRTKASASGKQDFTADNIPWELVNTITQ